MKQPSRQPSWQYLREQLRLNGVLPDRDGVYSRRDIYRHFADSERVYVPLGLIDVNAAINSLLADGLLSDE